MTKLKKAIAALGAVGLMTGCAPHIATSMWLKVTPQDSAMPGYRVIQAEGQVRHIVPIREWTAPDTVDTYHRLHHHGVAVESDKMAYRIYFDKKQTIDVYAKRTPRMELKDSYWYPSDEQLAAHYGDDVLRVSGTVGVGSVKYWNGSKQVHIQPVESRSERIVEQKRGKGVIEIAVKGWQVEGKKVDMTVRYTLKAGHRDMMAEVWLSEPVEGLCTGVQKVGKDGEWMDVNGEKGIALGSWGTDWPVNDTVKYAKETVGLGVYVPAEYAGQQVQDNRNSLILFRPATYHKFYLTVVAATKEDNPPARSAEEFNRLLEQWMKALK